MELRHANHCVYKIRYHMVFCVKYRKKLLLESELVIFLKNICYGISDRYCFEFDWKKLGFLALLLKHS